MKMKSFTDDFLWINEPENVFNGPNLQILTTPETDFWQRTHYGFRNDNGHFYYTDVESNFAMTVKITANPSKQYDQCGLMVRIDSENWIKVSSEYETQTHSRLGSVVTNLGYSDWATQDVIHPVTEMWYRIQNNGQDFLLEFSEDGNIWHQIRIAHLAEEFKSIQAGIYACSPMKNSFTANFQNFSIENSVWSVSS